MNTEPALEQIADAILDGAPVDWSLIEDRESTGATYDFALVEQLRTIDTLRRSRRAVTPPQEVGAWTWGHLRVFERIGQGAYGDVYRAWDSRLDREVALKLLPGDSSSAEPLHSTIIDEGRLLARVRHPNVATIYGAERIDGRVGLWMELVKGQTLEAALRAGQTFTAADVTRLGIALSHAVSAVHAAGLLHRDIKAQNVMLDDDRRLVLMDFGTGRELDAADANIAGTPLYLAPEVLSGGPATPQSDVYSIGVVLFRLLTNAYPVAGATLTELRQAHADGREAIVRPGSATISARLRRVVARAIEPDPARRFASVEALATALGTVAGGSARRRAVSVMVAAMAIVAAGAAGWNLGLRETLSPALVALGVLTKVPLIAVLPFTDAGSDPGQSDFIDGLTREVIRDLSTIDGLQVTSPASSFYFKNRPRNLNEIRKLLRADFVVEATVQRVGDRLQLNAQLVRASDDTVVWSGPYDRTLDGVFSIQEDIARQVVNKLRLTLGVGQRQYQTSREAYELYLRGRALVVQLGTAKAREAAAVFEQVIQRDPNFAPAHAGLADAYAAWAWQLDGLSNDAGLAGMRPAALRALQLDPMLAEAHAAMGITLAREQDWEGSRKAFEKALEYNANLSQIYQNYSFSTLLPLGEAAEAERLMTIATTIDPLSPALLRDLGLAQYVRGRYNEAIANMEMAQAIDPQFPGGQMLARALIFAGRPTEAIKVFESKPGNQAWERWILRAYIMEGRAADVERLIAQNRSAEPHRQAIMYAALGDKDRTYEALNRAIDTMPQRVAFMLVCPDFALLRGDPRRDLLRQRLNLK